MKPTAALCILCSIAFGQSAETPHFVAADAHVSANTQILGMRPPSAR
jgi:hypothetical protein